MLFRMIVKKAEVSDGYVRVSMNAETLHSTQEVQVKNTGECQYHLDKALQAVKDSGFKGTVYVAMYHDGRKVRNYDTWKTFSSTHKNIE